MIFLEFVLKVYARAPDLTTVTCSVYLKAHDVIPCLCDKHTMNLKIIQCNSFPLLCVSLCMPGICLGRCY